MEVEHRAYALDDVLKPHILRKLERETEQILTGQRPDAEPSSALVAGNRAAIFVVTHRLDARRRFGRE
jgi:hypothetical protein